MTKTSLAKSFQCAFNGVSREIGRNRNLKIQAVIGLFVIILAIALEISPVYFITILLVVFFVLILELFNENFEKLIDLISPEYNKKAGEIKDTMAGIVLLGSALSVIVGLLVLYEPFIRFLKTASGSSNNLIFLALILNIVLLIIILFYKNPVKNISNFRYK